MYIKTGDKVAIIAGKDKFTTDKKGVKTRTTGRVIQVLRDKEMVVVEGVNIAKIAKKPNQNSEKGQIISKPMPIHVSNVALIDPKTQKPTRVSFKKENSKKVRIAKSGDVIK